MGRWHGGDHHRRCWGPHLFLKRERDLGLEKEFQSEDSMGVTCFGRGSQEARGWFQHFGERHREVALLLSNRTKTQLS